MSKFELREDQVFIFKNEEKAAPKPLADGTIPNTENWPDYKGKLMQGGRERSIGLWLKRDKNGKMFFSGKIDDYKMPDAVKEAAGMASSPAPAIPDIDDIPF